jgi:hypothetical protein
MLGREFFDDCWICASHRQWHGDRRFVVIVATREYQPVLTWSGHQRAVVPVRACLRTGAGGDNEMAKM